MFSTVQHKFAGALSYFGYESKPSEGLPEQVYKNLEIQKLGVATTLQDHRFTSKSTTIWKRVTSLAMSYLFFSSGQSSQETRSSGVGGMGFTDLSLYVSEQWALPLTFVAGLSIFPDMAYAQSTFVQTLGGIESEEVYALTATPMEDFCITGYTNSFGSGGSDLLLSKLSSNGTLVWGYTLGGVGSDIGRDLISTSEGDLIVTGWTTSFSEGGTDVLLSKFSSNGTLVWAYTLGGGDSDEAYTLMATSEHDLIITGRTRSSGAGGYDMLLSKFSSNGTLLWANTIGGPLQEEGRALTTSFEGDLIVAGFTYSFGSGGSDVLLSKFSSNGTLVWANTIGGLASDEVFALTTTPEGDLIVAGYTSSFGPGNTNMLIAKFSNNGVLLWANTLGGASSDEGYAYALTATPEGDIYVTGSITSFGTAGIDILLVLSKFSSNGTLLWANTLSDGFALTVISEESVIVAGYTYSYGVGNEDVLLAKLNAQGSIGNCSAWQSVIPQVQSITPTITDVTRNITSGILPWTSQDAMSALNITDITNLLNQTTVCYEQTGSSQVTQTFSSETSSFLSPSTSESTGLPEVSTSRGDMIPSINVLIYGESYRIIINGQTVGTFLITGGSGPLDSNNINTVIIQLDKDIEDGEIVILFTIPEGEEMLWDFVLSYESESGCVTTEGVFTTTSEEEHSYQLIFEYESSECSQSMATLKLTAIPVLGGGIL